MAKKEVKTNALRQLDKENITYEVITYDTSDGLIDGVSVAKKCNEEMDYVFKTLVLEGSDKNYYVFVIPVEKQLDLKKAAKVLNLKSIAMIAQKQLLPLTGYVHGGCSPIGMKKCFPTIVDSSIEDKEYMYVSAGKVGLQMKINPKDLIRVCNGRFEEIV